MLNARLARPVLTSSRNWRVGAFKGRFNQLPPKKIYWGSQKLTGEQLMAIGAILLPMSWYRLVDADYQFANFHMAASHFNMDNLIIVDGNYRYIPSKMRPLSTRKVFLTMLALLSTTGPPLTARDSEIRNFEIC